MAPSLPAAVTGEAAFYSAQYGAILPPWSAVHAYTNLYGPKAAEKSITATVTGNVRVTEIGSDDYDTHHIVLDFGKLPFPVREGQSVGIVAPGVDANGRAHHARQYSIASPRNGERPGYNNVSLTIKRVLENHEGNPVRGVGSNYMCDLKVGDKVQVIGPFGSSFLMPNHPRSNIVMICTGTGSAPMRAMTEWRRRLRASGKFEGGKLMLFFGAIAAIGSKFNLESKASSVADGSVLHMQLDRPILDRGKKNQLNIDFGPFNSIASLGLDDILADIEKAKSDNRIKGIFLDLGMVDASIATKKEIRDKLAEFKAESGKPVVAFADVYTQGSYYLASVADRVYMVPQGDLDFRGLRSEMMFYTGLFEKLGVEMQFIRGSDNKYKSFGEAFTRKDMSEANKAQVKELLDGIWGAYLTDVGTQRKLDRPRLDTIAGQLLIRKASDAVAVGMVDSLLYRDQVMDAMKDLMELPAGKDVKFSELHDYTLAYVPSNKLEGSKSDVSDWKKPKVAIVFAQGDIVDGDTVRAMPRRVSSPRPPSARPTRRSMP